MTALQNEQIHLWIVQTDGDVDSRLIERCRELLSPDEMRRSNRFVFDKDRILFVLGHALVRVMLSACSSVQPREWRFSQNAYGKPRICDGLPQLHFNLTHTEGLTACVVSGGCEVGVDAEYIDRPVDLSIAQHYFSPFEVEDLERAPGNTIREVFFDLWTLKESYIKARGLGLSLPLNSFSVSRQAGHEPTLTFTTEAARDPRTWKFFRIRASQYHLLAVCTQCSPHWRGQLVTKWLPPSALPLSPTVED